MGTLMESPGGKMSRNVNLRFAISSTVTRSYRGKIRTCTLGKYARRGWKKCLFDSTDIKKMFLNIHRLFLTAVQDKVILSILTLLFAEPVLLRLPILIVLLSYGILFVHLSPLVVLLVSNLLSSLFIKLCSPLWLILIGWKDLARGH